MATLFALAEKNERVGKKRRSGCSKRLEAVSECQTDGRGKVTEHRSSNARSWRVVIARVQQRQQTEMKSKSVDRSGHRAYGTAIWQRSGAINNASSSSRHAPEDCMSLCQPEVPLLGRVRSSPAFS